MRTTYLTMARPRAALLTLGLAAAIITVTALALLQPAAGLALTLALLLVGTVLAGRQPVAARGRAARAFVADEVPQSTLLLELADGSELCARPVPLPGESEHRLVLTREGYLLLDAAGQPIYRL